LQWHALCWARGNGCEAYDWWGAPEREDDESDDMAGVWRFKQGFGAQFVEGTGAWDFAPSPLLYQAYVTLGPKLIRSGSIA
jgi:lipid II:glycine glycyltransferase (peptidoglycan interpeptide bridge formation enzyme)